HRGRGSVGGRRSGGARGTGLRREIAGGVICGDGVGVRRGGREACVCKGGRARRGDLRAAAVDAVAAHAHGIRRGRPGEIDLRGGDGGGRQSCGHRGRRGVGGRRGGGARGAGLRREIACGVIGRDGVAIRRGGLEACVCKGGRARRGDLGAVAVDAVAAHAHGIRRGRPGEIDLRGGDGGGRQSCGHRGRGGVGGRRGGGARGAGLRREIACGVIGRDGVGVRRGGREACVCKGGRARRGDLRAVAVDAVAAHAHGIRRGRPGEIDLRGGDGGGGRTGGLRGRG